MSDSTNERNGIIAAAGAGEWLNRAFRNEELSGMRLALIGRAVSLLVIAGLLVFIEIPVVVYYEILLAVFLLLGLAHYAIAVSGASRPWHAYVFVLLDFGLLTYALTVPNPFISFDFPPQFSWRFGNFIYFFILLTAFAFSYRPRVTLWAGFCGAVGWSIASARVLMLPETVPEVPEPQTAESILRTVLDPYYFDAGMRVQEVVVFLLVAGLLAVIVDRSRNLVARQVAAARERTNLSRYFAPNIVEELAQEDKPFDVVREQAVAVMFIDIVGFTRLAEVQAPESVIDLLRKYHELAGRAIFEHGGTLDKFLGDGVMATFGTPHTGQRDAANAISCARAVIAAIDAWNAERAAAGHEPIRVSIGLHYGIVVLGDVGSESRLEFAILGDTVNVASRLEVLTRRLGCRIAVSEDVLAAVREQVEIGDDLIAGFRDLGPQTLYNRAQEITVWGADR